MRNLMKSSLVAVVTGSVLFLGACDVPPSQEQTPVEQVEQAPVVEFEIDFDGKTKTVTKPAPPPVAKPIPKYTPAPPPKPAAPAPKAPTPKSGK